MPHRQSSPLPCRSCRDGQEPCEAVLELGRVDAVPVVEDKTMGLFPHRDLPKLLRFDLCFRQLQESL